MTVVVVDERLSRSSLQVQESSASATRVFFAETNSKLDTEIDVGWALFYRFGITIGYPHPASPYLVVDSINIARQSADDEGSYCFWEIEVGYKTNLTRKENPLEDPATIAWDSDQFAKPLIQDAQGKNVVNSAGDEFDPPAKKDAHRRKVSVKKNLSYVPSWILSFEDLVNIYPFSVDGLLIPTKTAKMNKVTVSEWKVRGTVPFREVNFTIHLRYETWTRKILDAGFNVKDTSEPSGKKPISIKDQSGDMVQPSNPQLLDGDGNLLNNPSFSNAVFLSFEPYGLVDFNFLPLR